MSGRRCAFCRQPPQHLLPQTSRACCFALGCAGDGLNSFGGWVDFPRSTALSRLVRQNARGGSRWRTPASISRGAKGTLRDAAAWQRNAGNRNDQ